MKEPFHHSKVIDYNLLVQYVMCDIDLPYIFLSFVRFSLSGIGGALLLGGLIVLTFIDQDNARHNFGHTGGILFTNT